MLGASVLALAACENQAAAPPPPAALTFTQVSAGYNHTCGLTTDSAAYCWGYNKSGELGTGSVFTFSATPLPVAGGLKFMAVRVGVFHSCGLTPGGAAYCWGSNDGGLLGAGTSDTLPHPSPIPVSGGLAFGSLSVAGFSLAFAYAGEDPGHTCGLTGAGAAYCWGSNAAGELAVGGWDTLPHPSPTPVLGGLSLQSLSAGGSLTCGLTAAGAAYCWGLGFPGVRAPQTTPTPVPGGLTFRALSVGSLHACALDAAGAAFCWGMNSLGALGNGDSLQDTMPHGPTAVLGGLSYRVLSAGASYTCGLTAAGAAYCWGSNGAGELGTADSVGRCYYALPAPPFPFSCSTVPVAVAGGLAFVTISAGRLVTCGVTAGRLAYCWGDNTFGQLGDGTRTSRPTPVQVAGQSP